MDIRQYGPADNFRRMAAHMHGSNSQTTYSFSLQPQC